VNVNQILNAFFDSNSTCPPEIPNCVGLREAFNKEVTEAQKQPGCTSCVVSGIKSKYIEALWQKIMSSGSLPKG
jgi:hypothetical protein